MKVTSVQNDIHSSKICFHSSQEGANKLNNRIYLNICVEFSKICAGLGHNGARNFLIDVHKVSPKVEKI